MQAHKLVLSMLGPTSQHIYFCILLFTVLAASYSQAFLFTSKRSQTSSINQLNQYYDDGSDDNLYDMGKNIFKLSFGGFNVYVNWFSVKIILSHFRTYCQIIPQLIFHYCSLRKPIYSTLSQHNQKNKYLNQSQFYWSKHHHR